MLVFYGVGAVVILCPKVSEENFLQMRPNEPNLLHDKQCHHGLECTVQLCQVVIISSVISSHNTSLSPTVTRCLSSLV